MMPAALPGFRSPLTPDELAGLACEQDVESRLVLRRAADFDLSHGPIPESTLRALPDSNWSLLVQDAEKHLPELAVIVELFGFIPGWRMDDLMISCAAPGGSVGAHVDAYDVFLVQGLGRRHWQIGRADARNEYVEDSELRLLKNFEPVAEWIAEPGDVLYLPPGVPHHGVAVESAELCMTYSVGFRAPSQVELLQDLAEFLDQHAQPVRYSDPDLHPDEARSPGISRQAINRTRALLKSAIELDDDTLAEWFGRMVSSPKAWLRAEVPPHACSGEEILKRLSEGNSLRRHGMAQMTCWQHGSRLLLFVDGQVLELDPTPDLQEFVTSLCKSRNLILPATLVTRSADILALVTGLLNMGTLEFCNDEDI